MIMPVNEERKGQFYVSRPIMNYMPGDASHNKVLA